MGKVKIGSHGMMRVTLIFVASARVSIRRPDVITCTQSWTESDGAGAAAPTRGDIFIQRQHSAAAMAAAPKKKRHKKEKVVKFSTLAPSCYGCGAPLQSSEMDVPGYVDQETYDLKRKHHQLRTVLCGRCRLLSHGHIITAVGGHGGYSAGKQFVSAEELREKLSHLRHVKALIVKLVSTNETIISHNSYFILIYKKQS
ncbi:unnamed protein product [Cuscuta campestris]|uniref:Uncharacterized protein n=1 Tax=Cuscuta campestris TaxID=132261 RepID=A0A484L9T7_9ASTE|nr:unnamed protein product [Cuscuta campestris]